MILEPKKIKFVTVFVFVSPQKKGGLNYVYHSQWHGSKTFIAKEHLHVLCEYHYYRYFESFKVFIFHSLSSAFSDVIETEFLPSV